MHQSQSRYPQRHLDPRFDAGFLLARQDDLASQAFAHERWRGAILLQLVSLKSDLDHYRQDLRRQRGALPMPCRARFPDSLKYNPDQPRRPAGESGGGQWTSGGSGAGSAVPNPEQPVSSDATTDRSLAAGYLADLDAFRHDDGPWLKGNLSDYGEAPDGTSVDPAGDGTRQRRLIDLTEHEHPAKGHTIEQHVGKSESYLKQRVYEMQVAAFDRPGGKDRDGFRAGSFASIESANKLVTAALANDRTNLLAVALGIEKGTTIKVFFDSVTGAEAYAETKYSKAIIRETKGVFVIINHDKSMPFGFRIHTAFPVALDRKKNDKL